jgi:hypothetical protein
MHPAFATYLLKGWHEVQETAGCTVRWTRQEFSFVLQVRRATYLCLTLCSLMPLLHEEPIQAIVSTADDQLGAFLVDHADFREVRIDIAAYAFSGIMKFTVRLNKIWLPQQHIESADDRELGVLVQKIWVE